MPKTYKMDIAYGKYYSDEGCYIAIRPGALDNINIAADLAADFGTTLDDKNFDWNIQDIVIPENVVTRIQNDVIHNGPDLDWLLAKFKKERDYQAEQAKGFSSGVFKDDLTFARYDQATKILDWVIRSIEEEKKK